MENSKNAVRHLIDGLVETRGLSHSRASVLRSTARDLRITKVVDAPNWLVSFYMPLRIFPE